MRFSILVILLFLGQKAVGQLGYAYLEDWEFSYDNQDTWVEDFPQEEGVYWLKAPIEIDSELDTNVTYGLGVSMLAAFEVYWDDRYIGSNGKVGLNKEEEIPGKIAKGFVLDFSEVQQGRHELKIKFSNHHTGGTMRYYGVVLIDFVEAIEKPLRATAFIHIYAGFFLIIGLFYLVRFGLDTSDLTPLLFGLLCIAFFGLIILEYIRTYYQYPYPWHFFRLKLILGFTIFISIVMTLFFTRRFDQRPMYLLWSLQGVAIIFFVFLRDRGYDLSTNLTMILGFFISSIIIAKAIKNKKKDAWLLLVSVLPIPFLLYFNQRYYDTILYIGFGNLVFVNLISLANRERRIRDEKIRIQSLSERLKLDLLKKNIQPHFINNSITSAIDWIERSPEKGVEFLFAISKEFDILLEIAEKKLIPLVKEIDLCRAHLKIMSFRKEVGYSLEVENVDEYELIPPAVLLTIIENGISHQLPVNNRIHFKLSEKVTKEERQISILVDGKLAKSKETISPGTGSRYIKARLEESYPGRWKYESNRLENGWLSKITIARN